MIDLKDPYRYVEVEGKAVLDDEGANEHIHKLSHKYNGQDYPDPNGRVIVRVRPSACSRAGRRLVAVRAPHGRPVNRLAGETSPYLLQHADNPVDWYPWGEEALERAREEDKPIFLSVGYSACHWCHVMERESFEIPRDRRR